MTLLEPAFHTDRGDKRPVNEDRIYTAQYQINGEEWGIFVVADGMGPWGRGSIASQSAIDLLTAWWQRDLVTILSMPFAAEDIVQSLDNVLGQINEKIVAQQDGKMIGTTLSILLVMGTKYILRHVGDSRIYILSSDTLTQLTEDHSYVAEMVREGVITKEAAKNHPQRNVITRCFGTKIMPRVFEYQGVFEYGDVFVLASDGFYNMAEEDDMIKIIQSTVPLEERVLGLRQLVKPGTAHDNVSIGLVATDMAF